MAKAKLLHVVGISKGFRLKIFSEKNLLIVIWKMGQIKHQHFVSQIVRWTAKIKQLTEQYKDVDVDEYKRIKEEKKQFQQQISSLKADNQRIRTQTESLKSDLSKTQGELAGLRVKFHFLYYQCQVWYLLVS